jgi:hypothetical protein
MSPSEAPDNWPPAEIPLPAKYRHVHPTPYLLGMTTVAVLIPNTSPEIAQRDPAAVCGVLPDPAMT